MNRSRLCSIVLMGMAGIAAPTFAVQSLDIDNTQKKANEILLGTFGGTSSDSQHSNKHVVAKREIIVAPKQIKPKKNKSKYKFTPNYKINKKNVISSEEVNTLSFPSQVTKVLQPPKQMIVTSGGEMLPLPVDYSLDQKSFSFSFGGIDIDVAQFTVSLANGKILSLRFSLEDVPGGIVTIGADIAGSDIHPKKVVKEFSDYDHNIIKVMKSAISSQLNDDWKLVRTSDDDVSQYREIKTVKESQYASGDYKMNVWSICGKNEDMVLLHERQFTSMPGAVAISLDRRVIDKSHCAKLYVLQSKQAEVIA